MRPRGAVPTDTGACNPLLRGRRFARLLGITTHGVGMMRPGLAVGFVALFYPALALAQTPGPPAPPAASAQEAAPAVRHRGGDITRDEYIERAKRNAERRFDRMDTDHDGILTPDERRAARGNRRRASPAASPGKEPPQ